MKSMSYNLVATWRPGKDYLAADALSRAPLDAPTTEEENTLLMTDLGSREYCSI